MIPLLGTLLTVGGLLALGLNLWVLLQHFLTIDVPAAITHPVKFWILSYFFQLSITWGTVLEKLRICSMPGFISFLQSLFKPTKDPKVVVQDLRFGTIPVRLFQPRRACPGLRRGIIFYHGGGAVFGNLDFYHNLCSDLALKTDSVLLLIGYRKLPDHHHPSVSRDCMNASIHFLKALSTYGVDPFRVVACGDSLGGGLAVKITQDLLCMPELPQIRAQVLIYALLQLLNYQLPSHRMNQNVPFLTRNFMMNCLCRYLDIDPSWQDTMLKGGFIAPETWKKYRKWLSSDNIPQKFKNKTQEPEFPSSFNESAHLETICLLDDLVSPLLVDDEVIARLPEAFLVSCENDVLRDDTLLYKKRLEDQGVPVTWYHVEDGFHGCILFCDKKPFSFPCSQTIMDAVVSYIKGI
uniref:AADACL4 family member 1 n=1 Tax=Jaculus jaculus TaxID=51337 RepID=A0A8C5NX99_JACJA